MPGKINSLRDKLEDNQLDLSLSQLTEVPVQDISELPKGTHLDLSNNLLTWLPENFPTLSHLIHLDLSKNQISELPEYFGQLKNLRHLDLYSNQLNTLPVTFGQLKSLKWLDLKNNPLDEGLAKSAGPCITPSDCASCAKNVVQLMQNVQSKQERERQKMLIEQRKLEEQRRLQEEKEREKVRAEKKAAKERKRAEIRQREEAARKEAEVQAMASMRHEMQKNPIKKRVEKTPEHGSKSCLWLLWTFALTVMLLILGLGTSLVWIYTGGHLDQQSVEKALPLIQRDVTQQWNKFNHALHPHITNMKINCQWLWDDFKRRNDYLAHYINLHIGPYFCSLKKNIVQWYHFIQEQSLLLWDRSKPYLEKSFDWMAQHAKLSWQWTEENLPKYIDYVSSKCLEWFNAIEMSFRQWMKT